MGQLGQICLQIQVTSISTQNSDQMKQNTHWNSRSMSSYQGEDYHNAFVIHYLIKYLMSSIHCTYRAKCEQFCVPLMKLKAKPADH